jgi:peptidoglycan/LPS O-acetylase OafA/YrhL
MSIAQDTLAPDTMSKSDTRRFALVEELRGLAAMAVVLFHAHEGGHIPLLMSYLPAWIRWPIENGHLGVSVFFVLSGFVIAHSLAGRDITYPFAGRFVLRRLVRLAPPYWFAIALAIVFAVISAHVVNDKAMPEFTLAQILAHLLYLQDILGYAQINPIFWTLCLEVQFYATYALMLALARDDQSTTRLNQRILIICAMAALVSLLWPLGLADTQPWSGSFLPFWFSFLLGVGAHASWKHPEIKPFYLGYVAIVFAFGMLHRNEVTVTCALTALVLYCGASLGFLFAGLGLLSVQMLGTVSYSLYLTHNPITGAVFRLGYMLTGKSVASELFWWPITIAACVAFATAIWWLIERPSMAIAKRV